MRKLKRISLISGIQILDAMAQKQLRGAGNYNDCASKTCGAPCVIEGYSGHCVWVAGRDYCECAVAYLD